jgi:hypothetical protein
LLAYEEITAEEIIAEEIHQPIEVEAPVKKSKKK